MGGGSGGVGPIPAYQTSGAGSGGVPPLATSSPVLGGGGGSGGAVPPYRIRNGGGTIPPLAGSAPNLFTLIPIDPANRYILAQVTIADPHHRAVLRSPHGDGVVLPSQRTRDGLFVFVVGKDTHWLLTVTGSDVVDLPISAGSDVTIALP